MRRHPLRSATDADLKEQFDLAIRIRDKVSEANNAVIQIREMKKQVANGRQGVGCALKAAGDRLTTNLNAVEEEIYQTRNQSGQDPLNFPIKINNRIAGINRVVNVGDGKPIGSVYEIFKEVTAELKIQTDRLQQVLEEELGRSTSKSEAGRHRADQSRASVVEGTEDSAGHGGRPSPIAQIPFRALRPLQFDRSRPYMYQCHIWRTNWARTSRAARKSWSWRWWKTALGTATRSAS